MTSAPTTTGFAGIPELGDCLDMHARFNFAQHLCSVNAGRPHKVAFIADEGQLSYGELMQRVQQFAGGLLALGLRREERVLLFVQDTLDWPVAFLGCLYAGVVAVPVNTLITPDDCAYMLQHSGAQAVVCSHNLAPVLAEALTLCGSHQAVQHVLLAQPSSASDTVASMPAGVTLHPMRAWLAAQTPLEQAANTSCDATAFWLYTSGSTGRPKAALHTHANPYWTAQLYGQGVLGIHEQDVCFSAAKLFFAYGLGNGLSFPLSVGATVVLMAERPTPSATFKRWVAHKPTVFFGAPTGFAGMLAAPDLPARADVALRLVSSAGEALPGHIGETFKTHFGVDIVDGIGSTEMLHIFLSNKPGDVRYGTTGWAVPGYELSLRDDEGQPVADGEVGDLYISGPSAALMYWDNRDKSRDTFQGAWAKSGDKYVRNADGTYTYSGRSDDMLKVSGIYVSPFEVEATLIQHPSVLEAAVIGVADENGLVKVKAYVVCKDGAPQDSAALQAFVKERLAPYKYPRNIEFLGELPKTATGKIQRFRLRALNA
jgi:benzoate-CoA ligase